MVFHMDHDTRRPLTTLRKRRKTAHKQNRLHHVHHHEDKMNPSIISSDSDHEHDHDHDDEIHASLSSPLLQHLHLSFPNSPIDLHGLPGRVFDKAEHVARCLLDVGWRVVDHIHLPHWLKDNDFLIKGHRPQLHSFYACFKSIFRIHTETGNIWTHLLGFVLFLILTVIFMWYQSEGFPLMEKVVFFLFFLSAILCLGFSWVFHTVYCHSENVGKLFSKLDYCGIALLIMGSLVPWLYYSFYCRLCAKYIYMILTLVLGITCIIVSLWDRFAEPSFRKFRAGMFIGLGLCGVVPVTHFIITNGLLEAINFAALDQLILMGLLYIAGAVIYASRFPERIWPGKFDIWFQSHQIFHVCVIAAAFVHYHSMSEIANSRMNFQNCMDDTVSA